MGVFSKFALALAAPGVVYHQPADASSRVQIARHRQSLGRENRFLSTFASNKNAHYLNKVEITYKDASKPAVVFNIENKASNEIGECYAVDGIQAVKVCGVQFRALVYLQNDCQKADSHIKEVKVCDATKAAETCVEAVDTNEHTDTAFLSNAQSYKLLPCDPEVPPAPVDTSGHSAGDVSDAEEQAAGNVAEADMDAQTLVDEAPSPPPESLPPSPSPEPPVTEPTQIPQPPQKEPLEVSFEPDAPEPTSAPAQRGGFEFKIGGHVVNHAVDTWEEASARVSSVAKMLGLR